MDPILQKAYAACLNGQSFAFATIVENTVHGTARKAGSKMIVFKDGSSFGTIGGGIYEKKVITECLRTIKARKPKIVTYESFGKRGQGICGGKFSVFIEPFSGTRHLIICGGGHIALPLSVIAKILNFKVTVIDSRKEFANQKRFGHIDKVLCGNPSHHIRKSAGPQTYIMIVTHDHRMDLSCLKAAISTEACYIGVIGSKTKRKIFLNAISSQLKRYPRMTACVQIPAGIDIGAQTPEEIAVSIMAEVISIANRDWLNSQKFREKNK